MNSKIFKYGILLFLMFAFQVSYCQTNEKEKEKESDEEELTFRDKIFFGGSLGAQFGSLTIVNVSPVVGYRIIPRWEIGVGGKYEYYNDRRDFTNHFETHIWGTNVFSRFAIIEDIGELLKVKAAGGIFIHTEYEALNLETEYFDISNSYPNDDRFWLHSFLLGGGYKLQVGKRAFVYLEILWNLTETANTPYSSPFYRIGFSF